jgi:hypothetical protein
VTNRDDPGLSLLGGPDNTLHVADMSEANSSAQNWVARASTSIHDEVAD